MPLRVRRKVEVLLPVSAIVKGVGGHRRRGCDGPQFPATGGVAVSFQIERVRVESRGDVFSDAGSTPAASETLSRLFASTYTLWGTRAPRHGCRAVVQPPTPRHAELADEQNTHQWPGGSRFTAPDGHGRPQERTTRDVLTLQVTSLAYDIAGVGILAWAAVFRGAREIAEQAEPLAKLLGLSAWRSPQFSW